MKDLNLNLIRQAIDTNGWFPVIDYMVHRAEKEGMKTLATNLDRAGATLCIDIEALGGAIRWIQ